MFSFDLVIKDNDWLGGVWNGWPYEYELNLMLIWQDGAETYSGFVKYFIMTDIHEILHLCMYAETNSWKKHEKLIKQFEEELWDILFAGGSIAC